MKNFGKLSHAQFAARMIEGLQAAGDLRHASFDADEFRLCFHDAERVTGFASLRHLYDEYLTHSRRDRARFLRFAVRSLLVAHKPLPEDYADAQPDLLPTIRTRSYFSLTELRHQIEGGPQLEWPYQILGTHLAVGVAYDFPEAMVMVQAQHLDSWGVTFYEVYEDAMANLAELDATFAAIHDQSYVSTTGDHYDVSRMILTELIDELEVRGDPVVMMPNRDRLMVTGSQDAEGVETCALVARQLITQPRPLSGLAFIFRDEEWSPWLPNVDHSAYNLLKSLSLQTQRTDYQQQAELLKEAATIEAAAYRIHEAGTQQPPFSYCVIRQGVPSLLPKVDRICILRATQNTDHPLVEGVNVEWPHAERILGDQLEPQDRWYPVRFANDGLLTTAQWAALEAS